MSGLVFTTTSKDNDTVVTHGLGGTPKIITITINSFTVPANASGSNVFTIAFLNISFDASGNRISGMSLYTAGSNPIASGGLTVSWTASGSFNSGTMTLKIVSVTSTTFTFRISYFKANSSALTQGSATGITYACMG